MEEIKKIEVQGQQYGVADMLMRGVMGGNAQVIEWSHTHNMNDYKEAGTYRIKGERTGNIMTDNLPIMNSGSGNSIDGVLMVMDSTLSDENTDDNFNVCITQFLMLSNRVGGQEGDMYIRSAYGNTKDNLTWKAWEKYQTNMEVGCVSEGNLMNPYNPTQLLQLGGGMRYFIDNGIYSGVYIGPKTMIGTTEDVNTIVIKNPSAIETFVMVVINNYAAAGDAKCVTQIKFSVTNGGVFSMEKRVANIFYLDGIGNTYGDFSQWVPISGGNGEWDEVTYKIVHPTISDAVISLGAGSFLDNHAQVGAVTKIGDFTNISDHINIIKGETGFLLDHKMGTSVVEGDSIKLPYGLNAQNVTWNHESNANTFTTQGYYLITGERTGENDNLPLSKNTLGSGHTLRMVLTVLDSSLPNVGNDSKDCCITQILQCSNRTGGDGNIYVRTASGATKEDLVWEPWGKLQTNVEFNGLMDNAKTVDPVTFSKISDIGMFDLVDNGIYSGVYAPPKSLLGSEIYSPSDIGDPTAFETFVMVVINNYAAAGDARVVTQIKFAVSNGGVFSMEKRNSHIGAKDFDGYTSWTAWESISGGSNDIISMEKHGGGYIYLLDYKGKASPLRIEGGSSLGWGIQIGTTFDYAGNEHTDVSKITIGTSEQCLHMGYHGAQFIISQSNDVGRSFGRMLTLGTNVWLQNHCRIGENISLLHGSQDSIVIGTRGYDEEHEVLKISYADENGLIFQCTDLKTGVTRTATIPWDTTTNE